jgi:acetyltransferase-like isoleucine patch superfamily enzyme
LENNLRTGPGVLISDNSHGYIRDRDELELHPNDRLLYSKGPVIIGNNIWIGETSAILPGDTVGDGAIIGANSVATKDIPSYSFAVWYPAKIIKSL